MPNGKLELGYANDSVETLTIGKGDSHTSPAAVTVRTTNAEGTDVAGTDLTIQPSLGTGTGDSGKLIGKVGLDTTTGATQATASSLLTLDGDLGQSPAAIGNGSGLQMTMATVSTTDATETTLATIATASNTAYHVEASVVATETDDYDESASYKVQACFQNDGGTLAVVGSVTADHTAEDTAGWACTLDANSTNIRVRVTGAAATNATWHGVIRVMSVS